MQDVVPGLFKFLTRPVYGLILRFLGFCFIVVGLVAAGLEAHWAGFTPVVWFLLALIAFLGVVCNLLAQLVVHKTHKGHADAARPLQTTAVEGEAAPLETSLRPTEQVTQPEPHKQDEPEREKSVGASWIEVEIYCLKCRDRRTIRDPQTVTLANGRHAYQGSCPICGTKVTRILKTD